MNETLHAAPVRIGEKTIDTEQNLRFRRWQRLVGRWQKGESPGQLGAAPKLQNVLACLSFRGEKQYPQVWGEYLHVPGDSR
jgi:hypothetical protein